MVAWQLTKPDRLPTSWGGSGVTPPPSAWRRGRLAAKPTTPRSRRCRPGGGLLCRLGWWAVAAVDPEWIARWWHESKPDADGDSELADLGTDLDDLGRRLAERWGC